MPGETQKEMSFESSDMGRNLKSLIVGGEFKTVDSLNHNSNRILIVVLYYGMAHPAFLLILALLIHTDQFL